jgi:hypothetical protein
MALTAGADAGQAAAAFAASARLGEFNPCWALVGDRSGLFYLDLTRADALEAIELAPGMYILENRPLGEPSPKVEHVRARLGDVTARDPDGLLNALRAVLSDHMITAAPQGDDAWSQLVSRASACCVHTEHYGTRSAMLIRVPRALNAPPEAWSSDGPSCTHPLRALATVAANDGRLERAARGARIERLPPPRSGTDRRTGEAGPGRSVGSAAWPPAAPPVRSR